MRPFVLLLAVLAVALPASANPPSPYAGQQNRTLKAMSPQEIDDLRAGRGMGLARAAELNSYPGPMHVLELGEALALSEGQRDATRALFDSMAASARALGAEILQREAALDALFDGGQASDAVVEALTVEIGRLQGRLRAVHLNAHIATRALLDPTQVAAYDRLRGYGPGAPDAGAHHPAGGHRH